MKDFSPFYCLNQLDNVYISAIMEYLGRKIKPSTKLYTKHLTIQFKNSITFNETLLFNMKKCGQVSIALIIDGYLESYCK